METSTTLQDILPVKSVSDISDPGHIRLFDYWSEKRGSERFPTPGSIDLLDFLDDTSSWAMLDVIDKGRDFDVVLCGSRLVEFLGEDMTGKYLARDMGKPLGEVFQTRLLSVFQSVMETAGPVAVFPQRSTALKKGYVTVTTLTLPLSANGRDITRLIHSVHFH